MSDQLALTVEAPLVFNAVCPDCLRVMDQVPVAGDNWHEAEAWCYLARQAHREACRGR